MKKSLRSSVRALLWAMCCGGTALSTPAQAQTWKPTKNVELIVPFAAGSGVDVSASTLGVIVPQVEAGKLRALAVTSPKRLSGPMAHVATWKEQGIAMESGFWRGILAPKGIAPEHVGYWEDVLARVNKTDEWQAMAGKHLWDASFKRSKEMRAFIGSDYAALKTLLTDLGMAK